MRTRLSYLALVLVPLAVFATALWGEFATPADLVQLHAAASEARDAASAREGILQGAMLDLSFGFAAGIGDLRFVRALSVLLLILCGLALWQVLERAGWSEFDATIVSLCVLLLPTAQLAAGWATAWPGTLGALLSLAGFAAVESELEQGGGRRFIAMLGGVLLYLAAAWCYFPAAIMALVPLSALALTRPLRIWDGTRKWFFSHVALLIAGVLLAWLIERGMMREAGLADSTPLVQRLVDLFAYALPLAWAPFVAATSGAMRMLASALAIGVMVAVFYGARRQAATDARIGATWRLVALGSVGVFGLCVLIAPNWQANYRALWPMAGVAVVCAVVVVRGLSLQPGGRPWWHHASLGSLVALGAVAAFGQVHAGVVQPLTNEWHAIRSAVLRTNFPSDAKVRLIVPAGTSVSERMPAPHFGPSAAEDATAARVLFDAAVRDRYPSGLPKGQRFSVEVVPAGSAAPASGVRVFDLTNLN